MITNVTVLGLDSVQWTAVSAIATAFYTLTFIASLILIYLQVRCGRIPTCCSFAGTFTQQPKNGKWP
jgi:hypothetical protein